MADLYEPKKVPDKYLEALEASMQDLTKIHPYFKGLIYGPMGVGKTTIAMQIAQKITPPDKEIAYIDAVDGWVALLNIPGLTDRAKRFQYEGYSQIEMLGDAITLEQGSFGKFGTVIVDEQSTIFKMDLDNVVLARAKGNGKDEDWPTLPDMGVAGERARKMVNKLVRRNINVIFLAHVREEEHKRTKAITTKPSFQAKFNESLAEVSHLVAYMTSVEKNGKLVRNLQVHPTKGIWAKSRIGGLDIHVSAVELIPAIDEWMKGERADVVVDMSTTVVAPAESDEDMAIVVE